MMNYLGQKVSLRDCCSQLLKVNEAKVISIFLKTFDFLSYNPIFYFSRIFPITGSTTRKSCAVHCHITRRSRMITGITRSTLNGRLTGRLLKPWVKKRRARHLWKAANCMHS